MGFGSLSSRGDLLAYAPSNRRVGRIPRELDVDVVVDGIKGFLSKGVDGMKVLSIEVWRDHSFIVDIIESRFSSQATIASARKRNHLEEERDTLVDGRVDEGEQ